MRVKSYTVKKQAFLGKECTPRHMDGDIQKEGNIAMMAFAEKLKIPLLLTLDSHFVRPEHKFRQDIALMSQQFPWKFSGSYHIQTPDEAWANWVQSHGCGIKSESQFCEALENNQAVVDMIEPVTFKREFHIREPDLPISISSRDMPRNEKLRMFIMTLILKCGRIPSDERRPAYITRLNDELEVIANNPTVNFLPYFVILYDICEFARENEIMMGPGRGSAAGSLLAYLLKITHLDPIEFGLSFARFLSLGRINRGKFPDIDLDFGDPKKITDWLSQKYQGAFARISTTGTMKLKGAIRDVSRALLDTKTNKCNSDRVDMVCETLPKAQPPKLDSKKFLYGYQDEQGGHLGQYDISHELKRFLDDYPAVKEGLDSVLDIPRSMGKHASAYCLSDIDIADAIPMCNLKDEVCTQFTMKPMESLGFLKIDLLGVNTLNDIQGALSLIKKRTGLNIDPYNFDHIPIDDPEVFQDFSEGRTETTFQFNTSISTSLCRKIKPKVLLDLSAITANGRPGTMEALMEDGQTTLINAWVDRRNGNKRVEYLHPDLVDILEETQGIFTYQEQMMSAFQKCCGFSEERSDVVREVIGKKDKETMDTLIPEIREILCNRGWEPERSAAFISACQAAAGYSFNKSHSASYAYLGYICGWLKHHYPLEWWTSVLSNSSPDDLRDSAHLCKDFVVPPDINDSEMEFYIIDSRREKIVYPLGMIRSVKAAGLEIVAKRPYTSLADFYARVNHRVVNRGVVGWLIWAGAFDKLYRLRDVSGRNQIYRDYLKLRPEIKEKDYPEDLTPLQILIRQNEALPLNSAPFSDLIRSETGREIDTLERAMSKLPGQTVHIAGALTDFHAFVPKKNKKNEMMCFLYFADKSSTVKVTMFNKAYEKYKQHLTKGNVLEVIGKVNRYNDETGLVADKLVAYGVTFPDESEVVI